MMWCQERQLQMEDVEDDDDIDDDDWEEMEIDDDMENMVDINLFLHLKKYKTHAIHRPSLSEAEAQLFQR